MSFVFIQNFQVSFYIMKSKDLQNIALSKCKNWRNSDEDFSRFEWWTESSNSFCLVQNDQKNWHYHTGTSTRLSAYRSYKKFDPKGEESFKTKKTSVILDKGGVNHEKYIKEVLSVALKFGNKCFGNDWTYQQDGATPHTHRLTQEWCEEHFPSFLDKNHWPLNSPDLNPLDYSIWDEFVHQMNWNNVRSKQTLIKELKRAVKIIRKTVVFESCNSFSNRLYRLSKNDFNYLH
jgi:hypothetical protein